MPHIFVLVSLGYATLTLAFDFSARCISRICSPGVAGLPICQAFRPSFALGRIRIIGIVGGKLR